jgi:ketosteroid isomerase-like protein
MSADGAGASSREVVRAALDALARRDLDGFAALLDADVTFRPLRDAGRSVCRGRAAVLALVADLGTDGWGISAPELHLLDDGVVAAVGVVRAGDGEVPFVGLHEVRDGRLVAMRHYYSELVLLQRLGIVVGVPADA